jgi:sugar lactone lactonase YvrE
VQYCKVDVALATGQGIAVRDDDVLIALARGDDNRAGGVYRWPLDAFPTSDQPDGGCDTKDSTGAPASSGAVPELFITPGEGNSLATPNAIAEGPDGHLFVSSVINGVIAEFTADGEYVRDLLKMGADEKLGPEPFRNGTPLGLGVDADGNVYYADIGIVIADGGIGPGDGTGKVRRIAIVDDEPQPPDLMDEGLAFPDGIGIWQPS